MAKPHAKLVAKPWLVVVLPLTRCSLLDRARVHNRSPVFAKVTASKLTTDHRFPGIQGYR